MTVRAYPAYRDSGISWIGSLPTAWRLPRVVEAVNLINGFPFDSTLFVPDGGMPLVRIRDLNQGRTDVHYIGPIVTAVEITNHDVLIGMDGDFNVGRWRGSEVALLNQRVCCLRGLTDAVRWLEYSLPIPLKLINDLTYSTTVKHLSSGQIRSIRIPTPPTEAERVRILEFLDRETGKIDALVAEQERLIALLKEKRQAVISQAVTKGLNLNTPMKDSGVPWLGKVPAHWVILPLCRVSQSMCDGPFGSGLKSEHYASEGARVIRLQNIRRAGFDGSDSAFIDEGYFRSQLSGHDVCENDVLIAGLGDDRNTVGRACVAPANLGLALVKADCFRFRVMEDRVLPEFLALQLTAGSEYDAGQLSSGSTRSRISLSVMATRRIALPCLTEQLLIHGDLLLKTAALAALDEQATYAITLLRERRAALISAAVTGKIDVRDHVPATQAKAA